MLGRTAFRMILTAFATASTGVGQAMPRVAIIELYNGTNERLPRFDSVSEDLLRDRVIATACCRVLSREDMSRRLLAQPIRLHEIYAYPDRAAALGLALQVDFLVTGRALEYQQIGDMHRLDIELWVLDVARGAFVHQQELQARVRSSETRLQHRPSLQRMFEEAVLPLTQVMSRADALALSPGARHRWYPGLRYHRTWIHWPRLGSSSGKVE